MREIGKIGLNVTARSGFDKSHRNLFTGKTGTLYPILTEEVLPNSTIRLRQAISAKLPPLAADTFMNVQLKCEAFFVPYRLLYGGWENWLMETPLRTASGLTYRLQCPVLSLGYSQTPGTLADFLGVKPSLDEPGTQVLSANIFPFLAYHRIYDDWYRNSKIQAPLFVPAGNAPGFGVGSYVEYSVANLPFISISDNTSTGSQSNVFDGAGFLGPDSVGNSGYFADGSYITQLHQRNFGLDYFTSAQPSAQRGQARSVKMMIQGTPVDVQTSDGADVPVLTSDQPITTEFTIAALRAQNSLQQFCERNNYSYRASDYYYINYGSRLRSGLASRAVYLGSQVLDVYSNTVMQNAENAAANLRNPFNSVGAQYGSASVKGSNTLVDNFTTDEPGILMVMASLVPKATYNTGVRRYLKHFTQPGAQTDLANAVLQNVGDQPIYDYELVGVEGSGQVFGYTDRYAEWMDHPDEIHGYLKDGQTLQAFALQRSFGASLPPINGNFLQIPQDYLDQVMATTVGVTDFTFWAESYFDFKVVQPLHEYSIPSLQDPAYEHGHRITVTKNGGSL